MLTVFLWVVAGYMAFVLMLYVLQRSMMYHPGHHLPAIAETYVPEMAPVTVETDDGLELQSWYVSPKEDFPVVLYFQGNAGTLADRDFKAAPWIEAGYGVWLNGYRGYGGNPGQPSEQGLYSDARAAVAYLGQQGVKPERIILYGESLGSGIATETAAHLARNGSPARGLVLEAPFTSMGAAAQSHYPFVPAKWLVRDKYDNLGKIAEIQTPVLIMHGDRDRVVPEKHGRRLFEAAREPKQGYWVPGGAHSNLYNYDADQEVLRFFDGLRVTN